jgi:hypothetical protein
MLKPSERANILGVYSSGGSVGAVRELTMARVDQQESTRRFTGGAPSAPSCSQLNHQASPRSGIFLDGNATG